MKWFYVLVLGVGVLGCTVSKEVQQIWSEADTLFTQNRNTFQELAKPVNELQQLSNSIHVQGRALTTDEMEFVELAGVLMKNYQELETLYSTPLPPPTHKATEQQAQDYRADQEKKKQALTLLQRQITAALKQRK